MCEPKLANGVSLPMTPSTVATCSTTVGERICISTVCDPKNNQCGFALGEGPCTSTAECDTGTCNPKTMTCALPQGDAGTDTGKDAGKDAGSGCHADTDCKTGNYCAGNGACTPTQPTGQTCTLSAECQSNDCFGGVCSTVVSSGSGLFCAMREPGSSHGSGSGGVLGLLLALAGVGYRRRRTRST
jgi:MYXO-CTERM domain-containing protein